MLPAVQVKARFLPWTLELTKLLDKYILKYVCVLVLHFKSKLVWACKYSFKGKQEILNWTYTSSETNLGLYINKQHLRESNFL